MGPAPFHAQVAIFVGRVILVVAEHEITKCVKDCANSPDWRKAPSLYPTNPFAINIPANISDYTEMALFTALRTHHNTFVCVEKDTSVVCDRNAIGPWETLMMVHVGRGQVAFRTRIAKRWLSARPDGSVHCDKERRLEWETFEFKKIDDKKFGIYSRIHKKFLCADGHKPKIALSCNRTSLKEWETFTFEEIPQSFIGRVRGKHHVPSANQIITIFK